MKYKGFTLIELLVTMGIIAVLTGMAAFNFNQSRMRARDVQRKSDLSQLQKALELYRNDNNGSYPETLTAADQNTYLVTPGYSKVVFVDPKGQGNWYDYLYSYDSGARIYTILACLENQADATRVQPSVACGPSNTGAIYQITNP